MVTLALRSCVARQEPYIPGALSILQGTVPGRVRGSGHMVPTYFRRELRDRVLQRPLRLRTFLLLLVAVRVISRLTISVVPRKAGYPVRRGFGCRLMRKRSRASVRASTSLVAEITLDAMPDSPAMPLRSSKAELRAAALAARDGLSDDAARPRRRRSRYAACRSRSNPASWSPVTRRSAARSIRLP